MKTLVRVEKVYTYRCDICNHKIVNVYWADNPNGGMCNIAEDGCNGADRFKWEHLCRSCRKTIHDAVAAAVASIVRVNTKDDG